MKRTHLQVTFKVGVGAVAPVCARVPPCNACPGVQAAYYWAQSISWYSLERS